MTSKALHALLYGPSHRDMAPVLKEEFPHLVVTTMEEDGGFYRDGQRVDPHTLHIEIAWASHPLTLSRMLMPFLEWILAANGVKWLQTPSAGTDNPMFPKLLAKGMQVTRSDEAGIGIAEFIMARVIEVFHPARERERAQQDKEWTKFDFREIWRTTWLVMGFGNIGALVGERARGFGAHVIGMRRQTGSHPHADLMITPHELDEHVGSADVVVCTLPGTDQTQKLIDADFLKRMKAGSVLVNIGRGSIVDEDALRDALGKGTPHMAILDVFGQEPLAPEHPFWHHPRVRVSAHTAIGISGAAARGQHMFLKNLRHYVNGEPLELAVTLDTVDRKV